MEMGFYHALVNTCVRTSNANIKCNAVGAIGYRKDTALCETAELLVCRCGERDVGKISESWM